MKIPRFNSLFSVLLAFGRSLILKLAVRCVCFMIASWKLWPWWNWQINRDGPVLRLLGQHHVLFIYAYVSPYEASTVLASPADILRGASRVAVSARKATTVLVSSAVVFRLVTQRCVTNLKTIAKETTIVGAKVYYWAMYTSIFFAWFCLFFFAAGWFWSFSLTLGVLLSYDRIDGKKFSRSFYYLCSSDKN